MYFISILLFSLLLAIESCCCIILLEKILHQKQLKIHVLEAKRAIVLLGKVAITKNLSEIIKGLQKSLSLSLL